jgi:hypothetical protein
MELRCGTWNMKFLYLASSLTIVAREIAKYKLHFVGAQEVGRDRGGTKLAGDYKIFCGKGNENHGNLSSGIE